MANDQKLTDTYTNPQPESEPENLQTKYYNNDPNIFALVGIITTGSKEFFYNFTPKVIISINEDGSICKNKHANIYQIRIEYGDPPAPEYLKNFEQKGTSFILYVRGYLYQNSRQSKIYPYQISLEDFQSNHYALPAKDDMAKCEIIRRMFSAATRCDIHDEMNFFICDALLREQEKFLSAILENKKKILEGGEEILKQLESGKLILDRIDELEELANNYYIADILSKRIIEVREINKSDEEDHKYSQPPTTEIGLTSFGGNEKQLVCDILNKLNSYRRYANGKFNVVNDRVKLDNENENAYFMLNVLICIAQNFITVFAGQPGTGKTSLCDIIAGTLGLDKLRYDALDISRYISVSVERGWNSKSELIGYYNAIGRKYEDSGSGLYHAMKLLNNEEASEAYPFFVLLDEANLSPVEHYWSAFMKLADESELHKDYRGEIAIGGGEKLRVPNQLRFLATINNDLTTEPLSPRLLDRTSVIKLPEVDFNSSVSESQITGKSVSWSDFKAAFLPKPKNGSKLSELSLKVGKESTTCKDFLEGVEGVYSLFKNAKMPVSIRIKNRIAQYIEAAVELGMPIYTALDYAIAQNLLPKINGFYEDYKELFTKLKNYLKTVTEDNNSDISSFYTVSQALIAFEKAEKNNEYISYLSL